LKVDWTEVLNRRSKMCLRAHINLDDVVRTDARLRAVEFQALDRMHLKHAALAIGDGWCRGRESEDRE
jgi:hypothetical protein